jgi:4-carboxymuconolactone decarboxylase
MTTAFLAWQLAEMEHTSLDARTREVVILAVGAVWQAEYELYAHSAVARMAGLSETAISKLCAGEPAEVEGLSFAETIAQRYATQLTANRRLDDDLSASARDIFGPKGLMDLVNLIGAYQTVCGTLIAFAIPVPIEVSAPTAER